MASLKLHGSSLKQALIVAAFATVVGSAQAQEDRSSANYMLPYCKSWLRMASSNPEAVKNEIRSAKATPGGVVMHFMLAGMCAGEMVGISTLLLGGSGDVKACIPLEISNEQLVHVVVSEVEKNHRTLMHLNFGVLASAVLMSEWPCKGR
jgi:hypothetical protein